MEPCDCQHVPERLHTGDRLVIPTFEVGELIYRRCKETELHNPFLETQIQELSLNRKGLTGNHISKEQDVLYNITANNAPNYPLEICTMVIRDVDNNTNTYNKDFTQKKGDLDYIAKVMLIHDPHKCMFPHCVFRVWLNDVLVTKENYKQTLKKADIIRDKIRNALGAMVLQKQISQELT